MPWNELSRREKQVIALAAYGLTIHHIALVLGISQRTVETYRIRGRATLRIGAETDLRQALAACWPEIVKLAVPEILRFLDHAAAKMSEDLVWAEHMAARRDGLADPPG